MWWAWSRGRDRMGKRGERRVSVLLTPQTIYHLERIATACGKREIGWVIDKLTREKVLAMRWMVQRERE